MSATGANNYTIPPPGQGWMNKDGTPTTAFYKFILNLFNSTGAGDPTALSTIDTDTFIFAPTGHQDSTQ